MPIPEIPAWILSIGAAVGSGAAAFIAAKAQGNTKKVQTEIEGPGNEPSLRQMLASSHQFAIGRFNDLNNATVEVSNRMALLENALVEHGKEDREAYDRTVETHNAMNRQVVERFTRIERSLGITDE